MPDDSNGLAGWVAHLSQVEIPVLRPTARGLAALRAEPDTLDARGIAHVVLRDPLMTLKLLRRFQQRQRRRDATELLQVEQVLMMMGLEPFFVAVPTTPLVSDLLHGRAAALAGLLRAVQRSHRASVFAVEWAVRRHDLHFEEVRLAALLSQLAELLLWCFAPDRMLEVEALKQDDRTRRSKAVQQQVFGFPLSALQATLAREWALPGLLQQLTDDASENLDRVRNVTLAVNLARHSARGWDDAALPDDYREIGALLRLSAEEVEQRLVATDLAARDAGGAPGGS